MKEAALPHMPFKVLGKKYELGQLNLSYRNL